MTNQKYFSEGDIVYFPKVTKSPVILRKKNSGNLYCNVGNITYWFDKNGTYQNSIDTAEKKIFHANEEVRAALNLLYDFDLDEAPSLVEFLLTHHKNVLCYVGVKDDFEENNFIKLICDKSTNGKYIAIDGSKWEFAKPVGDSIDYV